MEMDKKTTLTKTIPDLMEKWQRYKRGLKGIKITDWCISSDYCFGDPDKLDVATFTIFPIDYMRIINREIKENLPHDIKKVKQFSEKELNYLKNSKYFFNISFVIENLKYAFNEEKALKEFSDTLKAYETMNIDKNNESIKERHKQLVEICNYLKQKSHSTKKLSQMYFVAQIVSTIMEFLLIKEKGRNLRWCSDRGHIASFLDGIMFTLVPVYLHHYLKNRVIDYYIHLPLEIKETDKEYPYDTFIRVPDIITGVMSSLVFTDIGLTVQKEKHCHVLSEILVNNPRIIAIACNYLENGQPLWQNLYFESVDNCPVFKHDKTLLHKFQNEFAEKLKNYH
jgi:hypothetical protein